MSKKFMSWKTKGMNRDLSVTAFNPEFAFENRNLRLSTNEFNTLLSWVNEKGTAEVELYTFTPPSSSSPGGYMPTELFGIPIGTAVINHKLIVFTTDTVTDPQNQRDYIYSLTYENAPNEHAKTAMIVKMLFGSENLSLNFKVNYPLETLVSYESESIQKVYWTDGINQPRVINIAGEISQTDASQFDFVPELDLQEVVTVQKMLGANGMFAPGVIQYAFTYYRKNGQESNIFYTTPLHYISYRDRGASPEDKVENAFKITVYNVDKHFDYLRIYSIQRTSINGTPIVKRVQDLSLEDLKESSEYNNYVSSVAKPELWVNGVAEQESDMYHETVQVRELGYVECYGKDQFDYMLADGRQITIQEDSSGYIWRTANKIEYNGIEAYWVFATTELNGGQLLPLSIQGISNLLTVSYIDTGTSGDSVDPTELLYKGGESIVASTLEQKDGTLFLGNISIARDSLKEYSDNMKDYTEITQSTRQFYPALISSGNYQYANQLTSYSDTGKSISVPCGGFKTGDVYRLGVQFQHKSGKWSEPMWVGDYSIKDPQNIRDNRPSYNTANNMVTVPTLHGQIGVGEKGQRMLLGLKNADYLKVRPVMVVPRQNDRNIVCQGIVNTTLYTDNHKNVKHDLTAQASWFFRASNGGNVDISTGAVSPASAVKEALPYTWKGIDASTGGSYNPDKWPLSQQENNYSIRQVEVQGQFDGRNMFTIDDQYVTLNSPDIEFDSQLLIDDFSNAQYKQVGYANFLSTMSDIDIQTVTPTCSSDGSGFVHQAFKTSGQKSFHGIVSGLFYDDYIVEDWEEYAGEKYTFTAEKAESAAVKWMVYLWNKNGALNNDITRPADKGNMTAELKKKVVSNLRYSETEFLSRDLGPYDFNTAPQIFQNDQNTILKFGSDIYKGNIDALLIPDESDGQYFAYTGTLIEKGNNPLFISTGYWWKTYYRAERGSSVPQKNPGLYIRDGFQGGDGTWKMPIGEASKVGNQYHDIVVKKEGVRMKYKSTSHLVFEQKKTNDNYPINWFKTENDNTNDAHILPIVEIVNTNVINRFGGDTIDAFKENTWIPCGEPVRLDNTTTVVNTWIDDKGEPYQVNEERVDFDYSYGDTYFQRWDCLKTYAYTKEDPNQVVEIGSFMLETHTNIDGRYDRNRGQMNNLNMSPENFNLLNPVYSQIDNFFSYKIQDDSYYKDTTYPNQITWSKTKTSTADVDLWTNVTMASTLELDGDKGAISKIIRFNDQLLCFQDSGISQILYNENAQLSTTQGVPVEIGNSGKVDGKRYLSTTVGCSNKWSIASTPAGIYFMDSNEKSIYLFGGNLINLSTQGGFNTFCKYYIPSYDRKWTPEFYKPSGEKFSAFVTYYDKMNQDILFINNSLALAYSEKLGAFTSFYDYGGASFFCNLDDTGIWLNGNKVWKHQAGEYCRFFGVNKPYSSILIANQEPQISKIYTNLEFRASVDNDMWYDTVTQKYYPYLPFDSLEVWDEYQHGIGYLKDGRDVRPSSHHTLDNNANLNRKFRIWRTDVPRDNAGNEDVFDETFDRTFHIIGRLKKHPMDRMRNPWLYLRLRKEAEPENQSYADKDVEAINERIRGTVKIGDPVEGAQQVYTRETANEHNSHIEGAVMYGAQRFMNRTELQDVMMTYFD